MGFERGELPSRAWPTRKGPVAIDGAFFSNDIFILLAAAEQGLGIAYLPQHAAADALLEGRLVRVLPRALSLEATVSLVYPERDLVPRQVRAFIDHVLAASERFGSGMV